MTAKCITVPQACYVVCPHCNAQHATPAGRVLKEGGFYCWMCHRASWLDHAEAERGNLAARRRISPLEPAKNFADPAYAIPRYGP